MEINCPICFYLLKHDARAAHPGKAHPHPMCQDCFDRVMSNNPVCPICRGPISHSSNRFDKICEVYGQAISLTLLIAPFALGILTKL
jgi:hypothetical protein